MPAVTPADVPPREQEFSPEVQEAIVRMKAILKSPDITRDVRIKVVVHFKKFCALRAEGERILSPFFETWPLEESEVADLDLFEFHQFHPDVLPSPTSVFGQWFHDNSEAAARSSSSEPKFLAPAAYIAKVYDQAKTKLFREVLPPWVSVGEGDFAREQEEEQEQEEEEEEEEEQEMELQLLLEAQLEDDEFVEAEKTFVMPVNVVLLLALRLYIGHFLDAKTWEVGSPIPFAKGDRHIHALTESEKTFLQEKSVVVHDHLARTRGPIPANTFVSTLFAETEFFSRQFHQFRTVKASLRHLQSKILSHNYPVSWTT